MTVSEKVMERYNKRKAEGLCTYCGKVPAAPGRTKCAACLQRTNEYTKRYARKLKKERRCTICRQPLTEWYTKCAACRAREAERYKRCKTWDGNLLLTK